MSSTWEKMGNRIGLGGVSALVPGLVGRFRDTTVPMETEDGEPTPLLGGQAIRTESESAAHHSGHGKAMK